MYQLLSSRVFPLFFLLILSLSICPAVASEKPVTLQDRYKQAKFFYNQLETKPSMGENRELWLKGSRNFRKVYLSNPKSELAPASLFMLGKMYRRMFEIFSLDYDLKESIGYYKDCASLFPHHRLADDSLYKLGEIHSSLLHEHEKAAEYFSRIISKYPQGDMHSQASLQLKTLSSNHDIALPNMMIGEYHHKKLTNVLPIKYWSSQDYSRVIIKASGAVTYSAQLLEKQGDKPRRLYIDFQNSYIEPRFRTPVPISDGLLKRIRTGQHSQEVVRVVLDIESISNYKIFSLPDPFRVVVDVRGKERADTLVQSKTLSSPGHLKLGGEKRQIVILQDTKKRRKNRPVESQKTSDTLDTTPELSLAQQLGLGVKKIVIDPGHGGKDPGAMAHGLKEKDIVLKLAQSLNESLSKDGQYEVVLTRNDDSYISLEERTAIANGNNADLFVSLHVNAHPVSSVSGLETYFLNLTTNREAMRVAAFENATSELQMSDLQDVLADIMKNSKVKESSRLASNVHSTLVQGLKKQGLFLKDLGVKQAPFYVLIGAEMPSILIEIAFISNPEEALKLGSDTFLNTYADIINQGLSRYINSNSARLNLSLQ